jgi:hypothetical protein
MPFFVDATDDALAVALIDAHAAGWAKLMTGIDPADGCTVGIACATDAAVANFGGSTDGN